MGDGAFMLPVGVTSPGLSHRRMVVQGLVGASWGHRLLSEARHVLALSPVDGPDCDGNGVSDYVDVLLDGAPDTNGNLVPDSCEAP